MSLASSLPFPVEFLLFGLTPQEKGAAMRVLQRAR